MKAILILSTFALTMLLGACAHEETRSTTQATTTTTSGYRK